jgi:hypothetical protein
MRKTMSVGEDKMNRKIAGKGMVWMALALALAATAARAETKIVVPDDGGNKEAPKTPPPPPKQVQAQDSGAMTALQNRVAELQGQNDALQQKHADLQAKFDGSKGGASAGATDASGSSTTVKGAASKPPTVPAPNMSRAEPPPIPDQPGDKDKSSFGKNAGKTAGSIGEAVKPIGVTLGAGLFLFGVMALFLGPALAGLGPAFMVGGVLVALASVMIGGILQGSAKSGSK